MASIHDRARSRPATIAAGIILVAGMLGCASGYRVTEGFAARSTGNGPAMDTTRYETLTAKRDDVGLTDDEADELGKMLAEIEGGAYGNADTLQAAEATEASRGNGSRSVWASRVPLQRGSVLLQRFLPGARRHAERRRT